MRSDREKTLFFKALTRTPALIARVEVAHGEDVGPIAAYWGAGTPDTDIVPILQSLAELPDGGSIDVVNLLPTFAQTRLDTYPYPGPPPWSCHWTAMNFFSTTVSDRFLDAAAVTRELTTAYRQVDPADLAFGDVLTFGEAGRAYHSAVWVADRVVFTKNGNGFTAPWILMTLDDMADLYFGGEAPQVTAYRRRAPSP
jgi:hypothetical protein